MSLTEQGFSESNIASSLNVSEEEVRKVIEKFKHIITAPSLKKTDKTKVFELKVEGYSVSEIAHMLDTNALGVQKVLDKDGARVKNNPRAIECLELYRNGTSLEDIGNKLGITRERVRQITKKQFGFELGYGPLEQNARKEEIDTAYRSIVRSSRSERQEELMNVKLEEAIGKGFDPVYFDSLSAFASAVNINITALQKHRPDVYNIIRKNAHQKAQRWSWHYDACRTCGTTKVKHEIYGYCKNCYFKSPEFKAIQQRSHEKYRDNRLLQNKQYAEDYYNRPEVKEKLEREYDEKYFGGNRKLALERDNYQCLGCGMSVDVKDKSGKPRARVWHLGDKDDNSLENLGTYCQSCLFKYKGISPRNNFGRAR